MSKQITETALYKKLLAIEGVPAPLSAIISEHLQKVAELLLGEIGAFMPDYTLHNITHAVNVLDIINDLLPDEVVLNRSELTILIYAVTLHDMGMLVCRDEAPCLKETEEYRRILAEFDKDTPEDDILSELIRRTHVKRSCDYIDKFKRDPSKYHLDFEIDGIDFCKHLKHIILAHGLPISDLTDSDYPTNALIGKERINVKFLALLLRMGDLLDFDKSRTPLFLLEHRKVRNPVSVSEWEKHLSINGFSISSTQIEFQAECKSAKIHHCVLDFLNYIEQERKETMECIRKMNAPNYYLQLNDIVKCQVDSDGSYIYEDLDISFDYKKVLSILMGTELYSSPQIFLRELLQNAYDACFVRKKLEVKSGDDAYQPHISIHFDSRKRILSIEDNGIGMDMSSIKNYVTKIGNSYYQSKEFQSELLDYIPISNFGIGILSCFMVSDAINIDSLRYYSTLEKREPINITLNLNNSFVERKPSSRINTGTKISLYVHEKFRAELTIDRIKQIIEDNTAYQRIPIRVSYDGDSIILNKQCIDIPAVADYTGIEVISVDNEMLEGYLILHGTEHQSLVTSHKICQQGFRVNGKGGNSSDLKPLFIRFMGFDINIKNKMLSTKASREGIVINSAFTDLQKMISNLVLDHYKDNPSALVSYIEDGTRNIISRNQREYNYLTESITFTVLDVKQNIFFNNYPLFFELRKAACVCKVAFLSPTLLNYNSSGYLKAIIPNCDFIVFAGLNMHYFLQLAKPFCVNASEIVSEVPGLVYYMASYDFSMNISLLDYPENYSMEMLNQEAQLICPKPIFCYVSNNQYNFFRVSVLDKGTMQSEKF